MDVIDLDTADPDARRRWFAAQDRAVRAERPHALVEAYGAWELLATEPSEHTGRAWLQVLDGGEVVATGRLELPLTENRDVAWAEVDVVPEHRRRGVGRALWDELVARSRAAGRTRVGGEVVVDPERSAAPLAFADAVGAVEKHREDHLVADLPVAPVPVDPAYEVVAWRGRCPGEHRAAYLAMRNQMNADVPVGELELEAAVLDDARLASSEERLMRSYDVRVAAARRRSDGAWGGYSLLFVPHGADFAWQDDTLVMPEHRGHRLGAALKSASYAGLPTEVRLVHTWTAPTNTAMHRTNTAMGFRVVEHLHEVEAPIS